jgi:hypothetical protein
MIPTGRIGKAIRGSVRYLFRWSYWLVIIAQSQIHHFGFSLLSRPGGTGSLPGGQWRGTERSGCWRGFGLDGLYTVVWYLDEVVITIVMVPIVFGFHILLSGPLSTWLDGDLVRVPGLAQNLLDVLVDGQGFI